MPQNNPSSFFSVGGIELAPHMDIQSYLVNARNEYEEWTDADNILHRKLLRKRRQGSFQMGFSDLSDLYDFLQLLRTSVTEDGYYQVIAYICNEHTQRIIDVYLDWETVDNKFDQVNDRAWVVIEVTVMER